MKLQEAVDKGKEKGINNVRACVDNILYHIDKYFNFISQNIEEEIKELSKEEDLWMQGKLKIKS